MPQQPTPPAFSQPSIPLQAAPPAYQAAAQQSAPAQHALEQPRTTPEPLKGGDSSYSRKAPAIFAAIAAVFGVIIAVVALVLVLANRGDDPGSDVPTLAGPAPTDVRIRDYGSAVKLFWTDPANGRTSFLVTVGHPGEQLKPMGQVGPTTTSFDLNGLNAELDYCFAIVAVYSTSQFSTSPQTCTSRGDSSPTPKASRSKK